MTTTSARTEALRTFDAVAADTDAVDAALAASGDAHAFERLYRRHVNRISTLVRRMMGEEVDEITQEVLVRAWQKLHTFRGEAALGTWLHRLAVNVVLNRRSERGRWRKRFVEEPEGAMTEPSKPVSAAHGVDFEGAIAALSPGARKIFVLHDVEGYRHEEIADMLGISAGTSKSQLHYARMALRKTLGDPMMHPPAEQLSDLLDDAMAADEREILQAHLASCAECTALLEELRRVVARAQALEDRPPRQDLWPGVAAAIGATPSRRRRIAVSMPQLLAAGIGLMLLSGGGVALALRGRPALRSSVVSAAPADPDTVPGVTMISTSRTERGYDAAVRALASELAAGRGRLDSTTVRVVEQKLQLIDRAISEAERALAADPSNTYLHGHLTQTRMRKLDLLRRAARLARS